MLKYTTTGSLSVSIRLKENKKDSKGSFSYTVIILSYAEADKIFDMLMGDKVEPRREFIEENAVYSTLDV